jgi:two-component system, response regulator FlrC
MSSRCGRILVVEDDRLERESLVELLRLWGYEARAAADGWQALQEIASAPCDLVLSDAHMPHLSGIGLLHELQQDSRGVSCVIISGQEDQIEESEALRLGARGFLEKPIDPEQLKTELSRCLGNSRENESRNPALQTAPQSASRKDAMWSHRWRKE